MTEIELDGVKRATSASYAGRVSPFPDDESLKKPYAIDRYLAHGWMPREPFITKSTNIVAFGSCFAGNISNYLHKRQYSVISKRESAAYVTTMGDGMVHSHAIRQQFEWAWENRKPQASLWRDYDENEFGYSEQSRVATRDLFDAGDVFIITLGLSEIWYDEPTGEVFWRPPLKEKFDPSRHKFRVASFAETTGNIGAICNLIRKHRADARIVLTVSPIPLAASFRRVNAITANSASKAILRAAVDEYLRRENDERVYYFPSYDIVMHCFNNQWRPDRRHVHGHILTFNMQVFEHYYCCPGLSEEELKEGFRLAVLKDRKIGTFGHVSSRLPPAQRLQEQLKNARAAKWQAERELARLTRAEAKYGSPDAAPDARAEAAVDPG